MKKNKALSYGFLSLATIVAVPFLAQAGTWRPLNNQPPDARHHRPSDERVPE
jgi:hypothetical protein